MYNIICDSLGIEPHPNNGTLRLPLQPVGLHSDDDEPLETPPDPVITSSADTSTQTQVALPTNVAEDTSDSSPIDSEGDESDGDDRAHEDGEANQDDEDDDEKSDGLLGAITGTIGSALGWVANLFSDD